MRHNIITAAVIAFGVTIGSATAAGATEDTTQADTACVPSDAIEAIAPTREEVTVPAWTETIDHEATYVVEYRWIPVDEATGEQAPGSLGQWSTDPSGPVDSYPYDQWVWVLTGEERESEEIADQAWTETIDHEATTTLVVTDPGSPFVPAVTCVAGPAGEQGPTGPAGAAGPVGYVSAPAAAAVAAAPAFTG